MSNPHAEWFARLGKVGSPIVEIHHDPPAGYVVQLDIDGPYPTRAAAAIALVRAWQDLADLIATAPDAIGEAEE